MKPINQNEAFDTEIGFKIQPPPNGPWYRLKTPDGTGYVLGREPSAQDKKDGSTIMTEVRYGFINLSGLKIKNSNDAIKFFEKDMTDPKLFNPKTLRLFLLRSDVLVFFGSLHEAINFEEQQLSKGILKRELKPLAYLPREKFDQREFRGGGGAKDLTKVLAKQLSEKKKSFRKFPV